MFYINLLDDIYVITFYSIGEGCFLILWLWNNTIFHNAWSRNLTVWWGNEEITDTHTEQLWYMGSFHNNGMISTTKPRDKVHLLCVAWGREIPSVDGSFL